VKNTSLNLELYRRERQKCIIWNKYKRFRWYHKKNFGKFKIKKIN